MTDDGIARGKLRGLVARWLIGRHDHMDTSLQSGYIHVPVWRITSSSGLAFWLFLQMNCVSEIVPLIWGIFQHLISLPCLELILFRTCKSFFFKKRFILNKSFICILWPTLVNTMRVSVQQSKTFYIPRHSIMTESLRKPHQHALRHHSCLWPVYGTVKLQDKTEKLPQTKCKCWVRDGFFFLLLAWKHKFSTKTSHRPQPASRLHCELHYVTLVRISNLEGSAQKRGPAVMGYAEE